MKFQFRKYSSVKYSSSYNTRGHFFKTTFPDIFNKNLDIKIPKKGTHNFTYSKIKRAKNHHRPHELTL